LRALALAFQAALLGPIAGLGRLAKARWPRRVVHQLGQAAQGLGPVLFLAAVFLRLDHQHALGADAAVAQGQQARLVLVVQHR